MSQPSPHAPLADRANLKERDENVRFKQSMTSHVSREGQTRKLEANGNASRLNPMAGFVCGFGSCGDLLIEHPQTARTGTPRGPCLPGHSREAIGPVMPVAGEAADPRAIRAHHQPVAVMLDFVNPQRAGRWPRHLRRQAWFDEAGGTLHDYAAAA
jgi:hypothetical protein